MKTLMTIAAAAVSLVASMAHGAVFGSPAIQRGQPDQAYQITFIDMAHLAPIAGKLTSWELYSAALGDVDLQIWRPVSGGFTLVGENAFTSTTLGVVDFDIAPADQIDVLPGDLLGFRYGYDGRSNRVIPFDYLTGGVEYAQDWPNPADDVPVGGTLSASLFGNDPGQQTGRTYSLSATVSVPEPASVALAIPATAMLLRRRR